ncbi:Crp/Fnr family transcriptional regulator [Cytophagaceae bacterium DM2B3-1]|uniref:Crp/Fnr family transcriptional regulator n=1 Tax=Xanthocytophaga flava TaxID=3048013 RepID=A0ABT7CNA0_9BACT|nr:Crp/Fnr family transcriptional regulator [Xanthocytophaga flavus]MDJ1469957.1 Crp/Fnr family transcriptional regulator [Xanthocytophaga flavus]MDJ1494467.1 Crp/Fnr family transcriptional regulator [Xanthocytophaga flavus]
MDDLYEQLKTELVRHESLTEEEWEFIKAKFSYKAIVKSDFLLKQGQMCHSLSFVCTGLLRTYSLNEGGSEVTTHFGYHDSFVVSFPSFRNQHPSFENIRALTDSQLLVIEYKDVQDLFNHLPKWESIYRKVIEEAYACMEERNYILQMLPAGKRYELLIQNAHPVILQKAQLGYIASYLGITQETLSRIRKRLTQITF